MRRALLGTTAVVVWACASAAPATDAPPPVSAWNVRIATSGGFAGGGRGGVSVTADGKLVAEPAPARGRKDPAAACEATLTEDERARIASAVAAAKPEGWKAGKLDVAAPDAFRYDLTLTRGAAEFQASWYDNTVQRLPADLAELNESVRVAWTRALAACER